MWRRTITVGDIHGCLEEFDELMKLVEYKQGKDRLVLLGDLIDRGPDPAGVVRRAREIGAESVMGNHEEKAIRWRKHEQRRKAWPEKYQNPMRPVNETRLKQWALIPDELWNWIATWPCYIHLTKRWTAVHAGCLPDVSIEEQDPNVLMRMRYINPEKMKMASLSETGDPAVGCPHWTELWNGPRSIVYGHYTREEAFVVEKETAWTVGIDTACVHGGLLTAAMFFEEPGPTGFELWEVAAKKVYASRHQWTDIVD